MLLETVETRCAGQSPAGGGGGVWPKGVWEGPKASKTDGGSSFRGAQFPGLWRCRRWTRALKQSRVLALHQGPGHPSVEPLESVF